MTDEKIRAVLVRAAEDRTFFDALMANRESALGAFDLSPEEKALLMAPTRAQLRKMVDTVRRRRLFTPGSVAAAAGVGVVAAIGLGFFSTTVATTGVSSEVAYELDARSSLRQIAHAEKLYSTEHGCYGELVDLIRTGKIEPSSADHIGRDPHYEIQLTIRGDTFTATARHRTRPDTRPAFQVGPDGEVRRLD